MHCRSGWSPVLNAVFVCAVVLLLVTGAQPENQQIRKCREFLASVAGQPPALDTPQSPQGIPNDDRTDFRDVETEHVARGLNSRSTSPHQFLELSFGEILSSKEPAVDSNLFGVGAAPFSDSFRSDLGSLLERKQADNIANSSVEKTVRGNAVVAIEKTKRDVAFESPSTSRSTFVSSSLGPEDADSPSSVPARKVSTSEFVAVDRNRDSRSDKKSEVPAAESKQAVNKPRRSEKCSDTDQSWPTPLALIKQIEPLQEHNTTKSWAENTLELISHLSEIEGVADPALDEFFAQLEYQRQQLPRLMVLVSTVPTNRPEMAQGDLARQLGQINYQIARRLAVWTLAHRIAGHRDHALAEASYQQRAQIIQASRANLYFNVHPQWQDYLLTGEAETVFNSLNSSEFKEKKISRRVLSRANSPVLSLEQQQFLTHAVDPRLVEFLKFKASNLPDLHGLLVDIEKHENDGSGLTEYKVNDEYQNLLWSDFEMYNRLAHELDVHYRNANFRVSVSENFVNRLIPQMPATTEPFSERIMGAQVFGQNHIQNRLGIELIPDLNQIQMRIVTRGEVYSNSRASKSGFTVDNRGMARFQAFKRLSFGRHGVSTDHPVAMSSANQQMVGMSSRLDPIPLVGRMARRIARQKLESEAPNTERMVRQRVESTVSQRMQQEVETKLNQVRAYLNQNIYQPLVAMDLEPDPLEMSTSNERIVMRFRLAGRGQLAANSARPRAIQGSLMSMQIHQSAINNLMMRIELNGQKFKAQELVDHLQKRLGITIEGADEIEQAAEFEFAHFDPIRVDFADERIKFSVNLKSLKVGKRGKRWRNVSVNSTYIPRVEGNRIVLKQEAPGLCLKGKRFKLRDQLAVRTIFEALFADSYSVAPLPTQLIAQLNSPNLQIGQLVSENGWIGISVNEPVVQQQPYLSHGPNRVLRRRR